MERIDHLRKEIAQREAELAELKSQLAKAESQSESEVARGRDTNGSSTWRWPLEEVEYERYSRQMIVPKFGLSAQLQLKKARVLIVGAGGLGCPAASYLAGAGVGTLGLVDGDTVEVSNLHRQIAHSTARVGMSKVESAITYLKQLSPRSHLELQVSRLTSATRLNPTITYRAHYTHLSSQNARDIVSEYDYVLDCTDHPTSRYLISDICVLLSKPLISASAFQSSGQLITLNDHDAGHRRPCYRCVFPKPPPPESVVGCGDGGIIGPVVGAMGVLQALEAIKVITRPPPSEEQDGAKERPTTMLIFSAGMGDGDISFRTVRLKGRRKDCFACGDTPSLTMEFLETSMDYVQFCGVVEPVKILEPKERISVENYQRVSSTSGGSHVLLDVREAEHFSLSHIDGSLNIPISRFMRHRGEEIPEWLDEQTIPPEASIYVVCRVGNDSQIAAKKLMEFGLGRDGKRFIGDIKGGLRAWKDTVEPSMPFV